MKIRPYQICTNCIMDTSDPNIIFDEQGRCDYCCNAKPIFKENWSTNSDNDEILLSLANLIRLEGEGKSYDCIIGVSGGLDSSYTAYVASKKMGLRPLIYHVDAGWNTEQAVSNIEKLVDGLNLDLFTDVIDWDTMRRMHVAFLKSGIPDQDLVQDAVFFSSLYKFAQKHDIKHVLTGSNFSTEYCREPEEWGGYLGIDKTLFRDIWKKHGDGKPINFPIIDILVYKIWFQRVLRMKVHHPLNLVPYMKKDAEDELEKLFRWQRFQHKHHESRFTRFYEDYWLPKRFGYEKRRAHFSSLIITGQMTREDALNRISFSEMGEYFHELEFEFIARKLDLSVDDLQRMFHGPKSTYQNYSNKRNLINFGANIMRTIGLEKRYLR